MGSPTAVRVDLGLFVFFFKFLESGSLRDSFDLLVAGSLMLGVLVGVWRIPSIFFLLKRPYPVAILIQNGSFHLEEQRAFGRRFSSPNSSVSLCWQAPGSDEVFGTVEVYDRESRVRSSMRLTPQEHEQLKHTLRSLNLARRL